VAQSLGVISTMNGIQNPVAIFCRGSIGGAAVVIAAHGKKGFRTADPGAHFSLKLQSDHSIDTPLDTHESYLKLLAQILAEDTTQPEALVLRWLTQGADFNAQEAIRNGLIDTIGRDPLLPKA